MRYYGFSNYYLSQIQIGIQNLHCVVEIEQKYHFHSSDHILQYQDWAKNHKTVVLLNGGNQESLRDLLGFLVDTRNPYPFSYFCEDEQSLNNCLTCVGIILPEKIYAGAALLRSRTSRVLWLNEDEYVIDPSLETNDYVYNSWEIDLMGRMNSCGLA